MQLRVSSSIQDVYSSAGIPVNQVDNLKQASSKKRQMWRPAGGLTQKMQVGEAPIPNREGLAKPQKTEKKE
jgi:hypothetical protein